MASIILPRRFKQQPQHAPQIDRSGIGSKAEIILLGNSPQELVRGASRAGTIGSLVGTRDGIGYQATTSFTNWSVSARELDPVSSGSFTVNWYGILRASTVQTLLQLIGGSYGWRFRTLNYASGYIVFRLQNGFGLDTAVRDTGPVEIVDNAPHSAAVRYDDGAAAVEFFLNGRLIGSGTWSKDRTAATLPQNAGVLGHASLPHGLLTAQAYPGKLSDAEIRELAADPWGIFLKPRRAWMPVVAATAHDLTGAQSTQHNTASTPAVTQTHALAGESTAQRNTAAVAALTQTHVLVGESTTQTSTAAHAAITQTHTLAADSANQTNTAAQGAVSVVAPVNLAAAPSTQANTASAGALGQTHALVASGAVQRSTAAAATINQAHVLAAVPLSQRNSASTGTVAVARNLSAAPATQTNKSASGAVAQVRALVCPPSIQDNIAANSAIVQVHMLGSAACMHRSKASTGAITVPGVVRAPLGGGPKLRRSHHARATGRTRSRPRQL